MDVAAGKACRTCGSVKPLDEYYRKSPDCKPCHCAKTSAYYHANKEQCLESRRKWREKNREHYRVVNAAWRRAHPDAAREWEKANRVRRRILLADRRARQNAAPTVPFTPEQLNARWDYYARKCWICGAYASETDHVKPLSRGGSHMLCNLRPVCKSCNCAKHARWPISAAELARIAVDSQHAGLSKDKLDGPSP